MRTGKTRRGTYSAGARKTVSASSSSLRLGLSSAVLAASGGTFCHLQCRGHRSKEPSVGMQLERDRSGRLGPLAIKVKVLEMAPIFCNVCNCAVFSSVVCPLEGLSKVALCPKGVNECS